MSLIKFKSHPTQNHSFNSFFNDFFEGEFIPKNTGFKNGSVPAANIKETNDGFYVELAAPGMDKGDFNIELNEDLLSIRSEKSSSKDEETSKYTKKEFSYASFVRSFRLPEHVDAENIKASYVNGILQLEIPKLEIEEKAKIKQIEIK